MENTKQAALDWVDKREGMELTSPSVEPQGGASINLGE